MPAGFLEEAPTDAVMLATFEGEGEGEVEIATEGEAVYRIDPNAQAELGWIEVLTSAGKRGNVPESYLEWSEAEPPAEQPTGGVSSPTSKTASSEYATDPGAMASSSSGAGAEAAAAGGERGGMDAMARRGVMLATFEGEGEGEIELAAEGETVYVVDPDAEAVLGWIEVRTASGKRGNVPESYVEWSAPEAPEEQPTGEGSVPSMVDEAPTAQLAESATATPEGGIGMSDDAENLMARRGVMLATFEGEGEGEIELATEGETVYVVDPDAEAVLGWIEVRTASGKRGNVPESYVEWSESAPRGTQDSAPAPTGVSAAAAGGGSGGGASSNG